MLRNILGWILTIIGALGALPLAVLQWFPDLQYSSDYAVYVATFIPFLWAFTLALLVGLTLLLRGLGRLLAVGLLVVAAGFWGAPVIGSMEPADGADGELQVVSINAQYGRADVAQLLAEVRPSTTALVIQEFTPVMQRKLEEAGIDKQFPHVEGAPADDASGTVIYSKLPMRKVAEHHEVFSNFVVEMTVKTSYGERPVHLAAIHTAPPTMGADVWRRDARGIQDMLQPFADKPLMAVGDFNAVSSHATMRSLRDATKLVDPTSGNLILHPRSQLTQWQPTWPVAHVIPPFARIDHMLVWKGGAWSEPSYFSVDGTDHKGIRGGMWVHAR